MGHWKHIAFERIPGTLLDETRIIRLDTYDGRTWKYQWDSQNRLTTVIYPDNTPSDDSDNPRRQYLYEDNRSDTDTIKFSKLLTGIIDERGVRYATWKYDAQGRANFSGHGLPDAAGHYADEVQITYNTDGSALVKTYIGDNQFRTATYSFTNINGYLKLSSITGDPSTNCVGDSRSWTYDTNGFPNIVTDKNGVQTDHDYNALGLETQRIEAVGKPEQRVTTTQWDENTRQPLVKTEPGVTTTYTYYPDGKLQTRTETDTTGFQAGSRAWTYTWYANALLQSVDGPRTDLSDLTQYEYTASGALKKTTNALGEVTEVLEHTAAGLPQRVRLPSGQEQTYSYTPRGWLKTVSRNGDTMSMDYDAVGQLTRLVRYDGTALNYDYDEARRLKAVYNDQGERIDYQRDLAGNVRQETIKNSSGTLRYQHNRTYDELSRLLTDLGMNGQQITYGYDKEGSETRTTDALGHGLTQAFDGLNRLYSSTQRLSGDSGPTTQYRYAATGQVDRVIAPNGATTTYQHDGLGCLRQQQSPDTGTTTYQCDLAGNRTQQQDARGVASNYQYDALNRLRAVQYPGSTSENASFSYGTPADGTAAGQLTAFSNDSGQTALSYDLAGQLTQRSDTVAGRVFDSYYGFTPAGQLWAIAYPSGRVVYYGRDAQGRVNAVTSYPDLEGSAEQIIASDIQYEPFGPIARIEHGNGLSALYQRDQDYRLDTFTLKHGNDTLFYVDYTYDAANRITERLDTDHGSVMQYDALDRLIHEQWAGTALSGGLAYSYDANGNRLSLSFDDGNGGGFSLPNTFLGNSNRLGTMNEITISHDDAGNRTDDGVRQYAYNHANRMSSTSLGGQPQAQYRYNAQGQRVLISNPDGRQRVLIYDHAGHYLEEIFLRASGSVDKRIDFVWLDDTPLAQITTFYSESGAKSGEQLRHLHPDHLNTPRLATNDSGQITWRWESDGFGLVGPMTDPDGNGTDEDVRLRFPGQIVDDESGAFYNYFRDYEPWTGRYLESDPIGLNGGLNTYGYVGGNPLWWVDPRGEDLIIEDGEGNEVRRFPFGPLQRGFPGDVTCTSTPDGFTCDKLDLNLPLDIPLCPEPAKKFTKCRLITVNGNPIVRCTIGAGEYKKEFDLANGYNAIKMAGDWLEDSLPITKIIKNRKNPGLDI